MMTVSSSISLPYLLKRISNVFLVLFVHITHSDLGVGYQESLDALLILFDSPQRRSLI